MLELTINEVESKIKDSDFIAITWMSKDCPVCENFEEIIDSASKVLDKWVTYKIEMPHGGGLSWYEPHIAPTTYVFKQGVRQIVAPGETTEIDFIDTLSKCERGIWKTQFEKELEQLERLDK